jgi:hypothetical protein
MQVCNSLTINNLHFLFLLSFVDFFNKIALNKFQLVNYQRLTNKRCFYSHPLCFVASRTP